MNSTRPSEGGVGPDPGSSAPTSTPPSASANPEEGSLLSAQARWIVVVVVGMALIAAIIANWRFVLLAPVMMVWFSLPYLYAVEPAESERPKPAPHHDDMV
ncbi:MAG: hypothetical protein ACYTFV_06055 [Planctomycetota bacterium]|jgi:hypothetical protein